MKKKNELKSGQWKMARYNKSHPVYIITGNTKRKRNIFKKFKHKLIHEDDIAYIRFTSKSCKPSRKLKMPNNIVPGEKGDSYVFKEIVVDYNDYNFDNPDKNYHLDAINKKFIKKNIKFFKLHPTKRSNTIQSKKWIKYINKKNKKEKK